MCSEIPRHPQQTHHIQKESGEIEESRNQFVIHHKLISSNCSTHIMFQLGRMELGPRESQPCHRAFHHILGYRQADLPQGALAELPGAGVVSAHHPRHHVLRLSLRSRRREDETRREQK